MSHDNAERLQKALARLGLASRREAEEWIRAGRLTVNGHVASLGERVREGDQIRLDGRLVQRRAPAGAQVFVYHRSPGETLSPPHAAAAQGSGQNEGEPAGISSPDEDAEAGSGTHPPSERRASLAQRLPKRAGRRFITVSPLPIIDGGLEIVTSDGELAVRLQRCVRRLESEFSIRVRGELDDAQIRRVREGVIDRGTLDIRSFESSGGEGANRWYELVARGVSGKDLRQLFQREAIVISRILRTRLGPVSLERRLARGQFRKLTEAELDSLLSAASGERETKVRPAPRNNGRPRRPPRKRAQR